MGNTKRDTEDDESRIILIVELQIDEIMALRCGGGHPFSEGVGEELPGILLRGIAVFDRS